MANETIAGLQASLGIGAHANKWRVEFTAPSADTKLLLDQNDLYLAKTAAYPSKSIGIIRVSKQGRELRLPGETSYEDNFQLSFYSTKGHELRKKFIEWMDQMDNFVENRHTLNPDQYMATMTIFQLAPSETSATNTGNLNIDETSYTFFNVFPSSVGEISVDTATNNEILTFSVTFTHTYWISNKD